MSIHTIGIELTNECNLRCRHCLRDFAVEPKELPLSFIEKILKDAKIFNTQEISFTGGEPTLHSEFGEIVKIIVTYGYKYSLITNAIDIDHIIPLLSKTKKYITRVGISLDGAEEETNDFNRGRGSFRKIISSIVKLKNAGIPVMLQMCVGKFNKSEIEPIALFASHLGIDELFFAHVLPVKDGKKSHSISFYERKEIEDTVFRLAGEFKLPIHFSVGHSVSSPVYTCVALSLHRLNIDFNGYLTFCCQISNYRGAGSSKNNPDFVADLNKTGLKKGVETLVDKIHLFQMERLRKIKNQPLKNHTYFPCDNCLKYFKKV